MIGETGKTSKIKNIKGTYTSLFINLIGLSYFKNTQNSLIGAINEVEALKNIN